MNEMTCCSGFPLGKLLIFPITSFNVVSSNALILSSPLSDLRVIIYVTLHTIGVDPLFLRALLRLVTIPRK